MNNKKLIIRLSSLGDVIMASSALNVTSPDSEKWDWVIASEYSELIEGHPNLGRLWKFTRSSGFRGWITFCETIWASQYDEIFDLHRTLRTRLMKILFFIWSIRDHRKSPKWKTVSKQRVRLVLYFLFKQSWPKFLRPIHWVERFTQIVGGMGNERPSLKHLATANLPEELLELKRRGQSYLCVMPSSKWASKEWPVSRYLSLLQSSSFFPVILGTKGDMQSLRLSQDLKERGVPHLSGVGKWGLKETARILADSAGFVGGDTGLAHLAQAVGVRSVVIFGPTTPDMGFGPWDGKSEAVGSSLWCRPCGKDGRYCIRISRRYECLKGLSSQTVAAVIHPKVNEC